MRGLLGDDALVAVQAFDGSTAGPTDPRVTIIVRSPQAIRRVLTRPGELGFVRAFVTGDLEIDGDLNYLLERGFDHAEVHVDLRDIAGLFRVAGPQALRPLAPPPEEARLHGARHSHRRDSDAVTHHYDVSNDFYRLVLGESLTYSCAVFESPDASLEDAQAAKHDLVCRKLGLQPGTRVLDVGCGWGSFLLHAVEHYGVDGVGVTLSRQQASLASKRVAEAGLANQIDIRVQDYRDIVDGPFDAISSVGMFEHVGRSQIEEYFGRLYDLLPPQGRLLNHAIGRPGAPHPSTPIGRLQTSTRRLLTAAGFSYTSRITDPLMQRYIFPDAELHEVGTVVSLMQETGFEVRHLESIREHYGITLRHWLANLEAHWDDAVAQAGAPRARLWQLYMTACALGFERNLTQVHQVLAERPDGGRSTLALRPDFS